MHPTLRRLDRLASHLSTDPRVQAILGLGSAGLETDRFDDHSDIDFFVVVDEPAAKQHYLSDISWLNGFGGQLIYSFVNDPNGRKALFADGLFLEYAVFTPSELAGIRFSGARVVWSRAALTLEPQRDTHATTPLDTVDFHLNEALTNLYVGLHRECRGERLTAMRFIQVYAVDRVLSLMRLEPTTDWPMPDPFEPTRRVEQSRAAHPPPLADLMPGYQHNTSAAEATLGWLTGRYDVHSSFVERIRQLIHESRTASDG